MLILSLAKMKIMTHRLTSTALAFMLLIFTSCSGQEMEKELKDEAEATVPQVNKVKEPHRYGGWYCPDNFGFEPVNILELDQVPVVTDRLPTEEELQSNQSLINVDTEKYPDARALDMDLPRAARIYNQANGLEELIIVIQAIIVEGDTVLGYRFPNGGNGSAWLSEVNFLSTAEIAELGSQPYYFSKLKIKASKEEIWKAITQSDYAKVLGEKFDEQGFFSSEWANESRVQLKRSSAEEEASGFIGMHYGNFYLHIDYTRAGFHYSEKILMIENHEEQSTELIFANGPYPSDYEEARGKWDAWMAEIAEASEKS